MKQGLSLYVGCSEETGMQDVIWFREEGLRFPRWSLVGDSAWPVTVGEKGFMSINLQSARGFEGDVRYLQGGTADNAVPAEAFAVLGEQYAAGDNTLRETLSVSEEENGKKYLAKGVAAHTAMPENGVNAISVLCQALAEAENIDEADRILWKEMAEMCHGYTGEYMGVQAKDEASGILTCVATRIFLEEGKKPTLHFNIRIPVSVKLADLIAKLQNFCEEHQWEMTILKKQDSHMAPSDCPMTEALMEAYEQITGRQEPKVILPGGTYCNELPDALGYGMGSRPDPAMFEIVPKGHGRAHGPDECVRLSVLLEASAIYAETFERLETFSSAGKEMTE